MDFTRLYALKPISHEELEQISEGILALGRGEETMQAWDYEIDDVLLITHKGIEQPARVAGYIDSLDDTKPLLVNLRVSQGLRWGERQVKITKEQIIKPLPTWEQEREEAWQKELKAHVEEEWAKMSDADKRRVHQQAIALGFVPERDTRSPIERMIDRAVGLE